MIIQQFYKKSALLCALLLIGLNATAADQFAKDAPERLLEYLGVYTVNPPGNEIGELGSGLGSRFTTQDLTPSTSVSS